jgi:protein-disulfide isomerase
VANRAERRKEQRAVGGREPGSGKLVWVLGGAGVIAIAIVVWNLLSSATDQTERGPIPLDYGSPQELVALAAGITSGNPDAPVRIMEFGDYQCPNCRDFHQFAKPLIDMSYVQAGTAAFVYYDFPIYEGHPHAFLAARAARCAGDQGAYWSYHDLLFQTQSQWSFRADPLNDFLALGEQLGLNDGDFRSCVRSDRHAEVVMANRLLGQQLGVQGTPTILIDTGDGPAVRLQDWGIENIRRVVDEAIAARAQPSAEPSAQPAAPSEGT